MSIFLNYVSFFLVSGKMFKSWRTGETAWNILKIRCQRQNPESQNTDEVFLLNAYVSYSSNKGTVEIWKYFLKNFGAILKPLDQY